MNRIEDTLNQLKEKKEKAFITYVTAGYPDLAKTKEILKAQEAAGTDIVELGVPFSDPVADGPVIQDASYRNNVKESIPYRGGGKKRRIKTSDRFHALLQYDRILRCGSICQRV